MPRRKHSNATISFYMGKWPLPGREGELPPNPIWFPNPPGTARDGVVMRVKRGRREWWQKLRPTDGLSHVEAAVFLKVSRSYVSRLVRDRRLRERKVLPSSMSVIPLSELLKFRKSLKPKKGRVSERAIHLIG